MEHLQGEQLRLACGVLHERYKRCVKDALVSDVLATADAAAVTRKCGSLFANLTQFCSEQLRTGALVVPQQQRAAAPAGNAQ
jgi:hypothetical protein